MADRQMIDQLIEAALVTDSVLSTVAEELSGPSRRSRQSAAAVLAGVAKRDVNKVLPFVDAMLDALNRPEAQTRWEVLDALTAVADVDVSLVVSGIEGAESSLFDDEESGSLHLAAFRFLCKVGATTEERSQMVWSLLDEAIACYHGDIEFSDMLVAVLAFAEGSIASDVRASLVERFEFDAVNARGALKTRAQQIIAAARNTSK